MHNHPTPRTSRRDGAAPPTNPGGQPPQRTRHTPGLFNLSPSKGMWMAEVIDGGTHRCCCDCGDGGITSAAIVLRLVDQDGKLGRLIGPCHPRHARDAIARHANKRVAIVHPKCGKPGMDATEAAAQSNQLLFGRIDGPYANLVANGV